LKPTLFDEGLPGRAVVESFTAIDLTANAVGLPGAPPRNSTDEDNCVWCKQNDDAILVTNDRGKRDKEIFKLLAQYRVQALFVHNDLRDGPVHKLVRALLVAETNIDAVIDGGKLLNHRLRVGGGIEKRSS
jgi:hypothetical protein